MFEVGDRVVFVGPEDGSRQFGPYTIHDWGLTIGATYVVSGLMAQGPSTHFAPYVIVDAPDRPAAWSFFVGPVHETEPIYSHLFFRKVLDTSKGMETLRAMFKPKTRTPEHVNCRCVVSPRG